MSSLKQQRYWESMKGKQPKNMEGLKLGRGLNKKGQKVGMINCACGCMNQLNKFDRKNRERKFIRYHDLRMKGNKEGRFEIQHKPWNKNVTGYKQTEETKMKVRIKLSEFYKSKQPTSIEKIVYDFLLSKGVLFEKQKLINGKFTVDVYIPDFNLVIECDGKYWHSLQRSINNDKAKNAYLTKCGFNMLRLGEDEIKDGSFVERMVF